MITRVLPYEQWDRLDATPMLAEVHRNLDPAWHRVIATEADGQIVGHVVLMTVPHGEFLWIAPEHRGRAAVLRRLREEVIRLGAPTIWLASMDGPMQQIAAGLGATVLPGEHYIWQMKDRDVCLQP